MMNSFSRINDVWSLISRGFGVYRRYILVLAALSFISGVLEGIGINAIIPLFSFINKGVEGESDTVSKVIRYLFNFFSVEFTLRNLLVFIICLFIAKAALLFFNNFIAARVTSNYEKKTRSVLLGDTLRASWSFLANQKLGHLDQVLTTDVTYASSLLSYVGNVILITANLLVYIVLVINISPLIALLTFVAGLIIFFIFKPLFFKTRQASKEVGVIFKKLAHFVNENLVVMKTVKAAAVENQVLTKAGEYFENIRFFNVRVALMRNISGALLQPIGLIFIVLIFAFFYKLTTFSFASFAVIVFSINKVFSYIQLLQTQLHGVSAYAPYLSSVLTYQEEVKKNIEADGVGEKFSFTKEVVFDSVHFTYPLKGAPVLKGVDFTIKKGELIGLIGPSGSGKTTIVDLLLRLLNPEKGSVRVDGRPISSIALAEWRSNIGYVSQEVALINETVENNIRFYNSAVTREKVEAAARAANIYDFIKELPQGFETTIGERGVTLSGGQRQRIVLARILAREPAILLLDEATSGLDNESENLIQQSIERLRGVITVVVIAHRLSTVVSADRLFIVENGVIVEEGTPGNLLKDKNSYFSRSYNIHNDENKLNA